MLEKSLQVFQEDVEAALRHVGGLTRLLKKLSAAAASGDLREITKGLRDAYVDSARCTEQIAELRFGFDEESYFPDAFLKELTEAAEASGMRVYALDSKLYCYPLLVRVKASERAVQIGKKTERGVRPSALLARLRAMQSKPTRFKVWKRCAREDGRGAPAISPLTEVYDLLTLMPGSGKDYTREEFARDLYLLDRSGVSRTRDGYEMSLPASTGTRNAAATFLCIAEDGSEKRYYGIGFTQPAEISA
jgi:hypothetical protein